MKLFEKEENKPGKEILNSGIIVYILTFILLLVWQSSGNPLAGGALESLVYIPIFFPLLAIVFFPGIIFLGFITGTPWVSFSYVFARTKFYWRKIFGIILFVSVLGSLISIG